MVVSWYEAPRTRPGPCFEVEIADVVKNAIVARLAAADVKLVVVDDSRVSGTSTRYNAVQLGLRPMRRLEVEYYDVGKVLAVLVLTTKNQKLASLPETCRVAWEALVIVAHLVMADLPMRTPGMSP